MPASKTDTSMRFPEKDDQTRRLRNQTTQDRKAVGRMQDEAASRANKSRVQGEDWTPVEQFETSMDRDGNPVPDHSYTDYRKMKDHRPGNDEADDYVAATADTSYFAK
ncbi:uncharacterized protein ACLA_016040 [Aspergillus clavatus NRRL 1]|uniref:Uncharacterized protein n=1 Tax=Aspergillus clavatus (strain ATCC 1007 / CBS 513.65 / DSM 816 / NCTC 3887 / NRRL 1 / QM 1276 / 107) TaxID=344612 RepID=A1CBP0_ASPCL|nr:uncharacterized protein ACLA_016040 [Aspergillus clavatus NRRL 1]EAW13158.1 conserved hypothetical protein [Aspergillus clavatus NRRL 1]